MGVYWLGRCFYLQCSADSLITFLEDVKRLQCLGQGSPSARSVQKISCPGGQAFKGLKAVVLL